MRQSRRIIKKRFQKTGSRHSNRCEEVGLPTFRNISICDVTIRDCETALYLEGLEQRHVSNVTIQNVDAQAQTAGVIRYMDNLCLKNVHIQASDGSCRPEITDSENLLWQ
jgi:pectate lyase